MFFFLPDLLSGQGTHVENLLLKGDSLLFIKQHDEARNLYEEAKIYSEKNRLDFFKQFSTYKIGYSYLREDSEFLAMAYFTEVQIDLIPENGRDSALYFLVSLEIDIISYNTVKSGYNPLVIEEQVSEYISYLSKNEEGRIQYLLAKVFVQRLEHIEAIDRFKVLLNNQILDPWLYELAIFNIAKEYEIIREYQAAITFHKAIEVMDLLYLEKPLVFENLWQCYYKLRIYNSALDYLKRARATYSTGLKKKYFNQNIQFQGYTYFMLGEPELAFAMLDSAENFSRIAKDYKSLIQVYIKKAYCYRRLGDFNNAYRCIKDGYKLDVSFDDYYGFFNIYNDISRFYLESGDLNKALEIVKKFDSLNVDTKFLGSNTIDFKARKRRFMIGKGLIYRAVWESDSSNIEALNQAHQTFMEVLKISKNIYENLEHEQTKLAVVKSLRIDYENLFLTSYNLYNINKDQRYLEDMFHFQQQGKATLFKSNLHESEALNKSNIPEDLLKKEVECRRQIERLNFYINPTSSTSLNEKIQDNLYKELVNVRLSYDSLLNHLEEEYPNYQQQKYGIDIYGIKDMQEALEKDQLVIDYFITEGRLFKMLISTTEVLLFESNVDEDIQKDMINYRGLLQDPGLNNFGETNINSLVNLSHKLYGILLGDVENYLQGRRLFIIPDNELNLVPFETLIVKPVDTLANKAGNSLPYLVKTNPVSVLYSQSQLLDKSHKISKHSKLIGFAPDYSTFKDSNLVILPGALEEITRIRKIFRGTTYSGVDATKENFENESVNYDIVHLALHTIINNNNPKYSQLVFSNTNNLTNTYLTSFEVYGLRFKTDLLVLSGCNTGVGKIKSGEGVMHLARNFFFAGIKNIVLTQWAVADKSSAEIMEYFYTHLHNGNSVDIALQKAKIDFLLYEDPLKHHPYYWAGYIATGKPVECTFRINNLWFLMLFLLIPIIIIKRKRSI